MLWRKRHFDFNSLAGLKDAFHGTFSYRDPKGKTVFPKEVKDWWQGDKYQDLSILEAIRQVLVHRGGRADASFLERVKHIHPTLSKLKINEAVPVDGEFVRQSIDAVTKRAIILLTGVAQWLKRAGT